MKNREFDNILNECLERLLVKGESLEQCLQSYPEQAAELKPLLETALAAREASNIQPRPDFKARARHQFRAALKETAAGKSRTSWGWFPRWATVMAIVLVLVLGGGGTVAAADSSMPDNPLYSVKLATEQVRLTLTPSQIGKARICAQLSGRRVAEIAYMAGKGDTQQVERITRRLDEKLKLLVVLLDGRGGDDAEMLVAPSAGEAQPTSPLQETAAPTETPATGEAPPETALAPSPGKGWEEGDTSIRNGNRAQLRDTLVSDAASNRAALRDILDKVPESTRDALRRALEISEFGYEEALKALE